MTEIRDDRLDRAWRRFVREFLPRQDDDGAKRCVYRFSNFDDAERRVFEYAGMRHLRRELNDGRKTWREGRQVKTWPRHGLWNAAVLRSLARPQRPFEARRDPKRPSWGAAELTYTTVRSSVGCWPVCDPPARPREIGCQVAKRKSYTLSEPHRS
jgi:hypothetical protein